MAGLNARGLQSRERPNVLQNVPIINPLRMRSEGYCSCRVCVSVCYSITHFTSGYSRPKRTHIFSGGWRSKNM